MDSQSVYEVKSVDLEVTKSKPPHVKVKATGTVRTGGWTNARLEPVIYVTPPKDGIQDIEFVADKPSGPSTDGITEIKSAQLDMGQLPSG